MIDKELFRLIGGNKKYIFIAVALQVLGLIAKRFDHGKRMLCRVSVIEKNAEAVLFIYPLIGAAIGTSMALQARKIAVTCKPLFHQGRSVPLCCI